MLNLMTALVTGRRRFLVALPLLFALLAPLALAQAPSRVVAVGDVHGDYDAFVAILQQAGLLDAKLRWAGKNATLVQTGDFLDRGAKCREVMDLLMALEKQAPRQGGQVVTLLGNHEAMNVMGDLRYAEPMYASFADKSSEHRRKDAYAAFVAWQKARAAAGRLVAAAPAPDTEAGWMAAHPLGYVEQRDAMGPAGKYGRWLRERPAVVQIGSTLFVHGGISPEIAGWKPDAIAKRVRSELQAFDEYKQHFVTQDVVLPHFDLEQITAAVRAELEFRNAELARKMEEAAQAAAKAGRPGKPEEGFEREKKQNRLFSDFLGYNIWFSVHSAGPLWYRGYSTWSDADGTAQVAKLLESLGVSQIVVGHTPQKDGRIAARFDGKIFLIDTGMLSSYYNGGRASALEIAAGKFTAIYSDQRIVLFDPARAIAPASPSSREESNSGETLGGGLDEQQVPPQQPPPAAASGATAPVAAPAARVWLDPEGKPLPFQSDAELIEFMRTANVVSMKAAPKGITNPRKTLLEKDGLRMNAIFRAISEEKDSAQMAGGKRELFFRDDYIFENAAYELSLMLGMDNVPPTVLRRVNSERGNLQVWVENCMDEGRRQKEKIPPPDVRRWNEQMQLMRFFDNFVYNTDRNVGNILIDKDWKVWLIDHTRAFRRHDNLQSPDTLVEIERNVWEKLLALDERTVKERLKPYLRVFEIDALLKRRKRIIEHYRAEIAKRGESEVIRDLK